MNSFTKISEVDLQLQLRLSIMDIEFIEIQHRQNVLKLMQICGIDLKEAYQLYMDSGYNFEAAVNKKFNPIPVSPPVNTVPQYIPQIPLMNFGGNEFYDSGDYDDDTDFKYLEYKKFMSSGKNFESKYPIRQHQSFFSKLVPKFFKGEDEDPFKSKLQTYIERRVNLKNTPGNLSQILQWSWKEKYPVIVLILDFSSDKKAEVKKLFQDEMFVQQVLNQQFKMYGVDAYKYQLENQLKLHFNLERDANHFVICRVDYLDDVKILSRFKITESFEEIRKKLKQVKSQCIQIQMEESNIAKQYIEQRSGNFNYRRPKTIKQSLKMKQDRNIRKQQQQQFFKACRPKEETIEKNQKIEKKQDKKQQKKQYKQQIVQKKEEKPAKVILSEQQIRNRRQQKFNSIKKYSSGLDFKIRVPSGQNLIISVDPEETVQYLFNYISFVPNDLGFVNDEIRQFDIFVGFGGSERLKGKQSAKLNTLFEDSQVLIVRETIE